jgi:hypothetical protein
MGHSVTFVAPIFGKKSVTPRLDGDLKSPLNTTGGSQ